MRCVVNQFIDTGRHVVGIVKDHVIDAELPEFPLRNLLELRCCCQSRTETERTGQPYL